MKKKLIAAGILALLPLSAASAMDVGTFLQKADALEKKGMMALFSSDYKLLKGEVVRASEQLRAERLAAKAAGKPQAYCPTEGGKGLGSSEILAAFRTIPPVQRPRIDVKTALKALLAKKYPCRG